MGGLTGPAAPASPCNGICRIDPATRRCLGCARTLDEIAAWPTLTPAAQQAVIDQLPGRQVSAR